MQATPDDDRPRDDHLPLDQAPATPLMAEADRMRALALVGVSREADLPVAAEIHEEMQLVEPSARGLYQLVDALRRRYEVGDPPRRTSGLHEGEPYTNALLKHFKELDPELVHERLPRLRYLHDAIAVHLRHMRVAISTRTFQAIEASVQLADGSDVALAIERFDDRGQNDLDGAAALERLAERIDRLPGAADRPVVFWDVEVHRMAERHGLCAARATFGPVEQVWPLDGAEFAGDVTGATIGDGFDRGRGRDGYQLLHDNNRRLVAFHRLRTNQGTLPGFWLYRDRPGSAGRPHVDALRHYVDRLRRDGRAPLAALQLHNFSAQVGRTGTAVTPGRNALMFEQYMTLPVLAGAMLHHRPGGHAQPGPEPTA